MTDTSSYRTENGGLRFFDKETDFGFTLTPTTEYSSKGEEKVHVVLDDFDAAFVIDYARLRVLAGALNCVLAKRAGGGA